MEINKMSKLTIVRQSLETNPEGVIVKVFEENHLPNGNWAGWHHFVDFWVAPRRGLYTAEELQEFMMSLVPKGLQPTQKDDFRQYNKKSVLEFGRLYFDEVIGQEKVTRICTLADEELFNTNGFVNGQRTIEELIQYQRRILVRPFPSEVFVRDLLEGKLHGYDENLVKPKELKKYKSGSTRSFLQRVVGRK